MNKPISLMTGKECTPTELNDLRDIEFDVQGGAAWHSGLDVYMRGRNYNLSHDAKDRYIVTGFITEKYVIGESDPSIEPAFSLSLQSAQNLMDELWGAGVRPGERNIPAASTTDAIEKHLEDMRKIAFMFLGEKDD